MRSWTSVLSGVAAGGVCAGCFSTAFVGAPSRGVSSLDVRMAGASTQTQGFGESLSGSTSFFAACSLAAVGAAVARRTSIQRKAAKEEITANIPRPEDLLESPKFPLYMGSSGGYMSKATRERHAITWTAKDEATFEMPTGGVAFMNKGENLCYFRKKEQCLSVGKQLRKMKIENYKIYRIAKDGTVSFMHPADGVFPEKVNKGRVQVNGRPHTVAQNPELGLLKYTKYHGKAYETDFVTTMFVKARLQAFQDKENLFPIPKVTDIVSNEEYEEYTTKLDKMMADVKSTQEKSI
jgi:photosystem I subunit 2